jgi:phospholipid/cholesterol/gamma-HCH transport system ATP-binding protein
MENSFDKDVVISVSDIRKSFGDNVVLDGITLDICKGENFVVLGRSGSGKSVLIKIIAGLLQPDGGTVYVLGQDVPDLDRKALQLLRQKIGFLFQSSALYDSMTVRENLKFPLVRNKRNLTAPEVNKAIQQVLEDVGLLETIDQIPAELSGGQRKRIGIARTLIMNPEVMLYDEPTAGLDPITSVEINNLILDVQEQYNTSSIVITHDLTCAKTVGDRVAILAEGQFFRQGSFEEVFKSDDKLVRGFYDYNFILEPATKKKRRQVQVC